MGDPLRITDIAFFLSHFFARLADQMLLFLVPLVVFQTTQSASLSGLAFFSLVVCSSRRGRFETAALAQSFKVQGELPAVGSMALLQCSQQMALHLLRA